MKTRLAFGGRLGDAPLSVDAEAVRIGFGGSTAAPRAGLALGPAALALKQPDGETRLALTELTAEAGRVGPRGSFVGAGSTDTSPERKRMSTSFEYLRIRCQL